MVPLFGAANAAPNKGTTILYWFRSPKTLLNHYPPVNGKIQGLFKTFECSSSIFPDKFHFQVLLKAVLYVQVLFKPVPTLNQLNRSSTIGSTVKPVWNNHSQKDQKLVFKTNYRLMQVISIAECSKGSILQYFRPSLRYHLSLHVLSGLLDRFYCTLLTVLVEPLFTESFQFCPNLSLPVTTPNNMDQNSDCFLDHRSS